MYEYIFKFSSVVQTAPTNGHQMEDVTPITPAGHVSEVNCFYLEGSVAVRLIFHTIILLPVPVMNLVR